MPTDLEIAQLTAALEQASTKNWSSFDHVEPPQQDGGVCWGIKAFDDATVVVMRGSITKQDWFRDFLAMPAHEVSPYEKLGPVHLGFSIGLPAAWKIIKPGVTVRQKPLILAGHSLGAARAWILAGMAIVDGVVAARVVVFGSPRPGFAQLASVVAEAPQKSYRNRLDPVCEVPFNIPPKFPYVEPAPFTMLDVEPAAEDEWGPLADHHMPLYVAGLSPSKPGQLN